MKKIATRFTECLLAGGMVYAIAVLLAVPAKAAACNCTNIAASAGTTCWLTHNADGMNTPEDGRLISCNSTSWSILCEDNIIISGGCS